MEGSMFQAASGRRLVQISTNDPVLRAFYEFNNESLSELLENDPEQLERPLDYVNPLVCLAAKEDRDDVLMLVNSLNGSLALRNAERMNPLHVAVMYRALKAVNYLTFDKSNDVNEPYPNGDRLLHRACMNVSASVVQQLLRVGADANLENALGQLPLHKACEEESVELALLLLPKTDNVSHEGHEGRTPLHIAASNQSLKLMKVLLAYGADINRYDKNRETPIDVVIQMGNKNIISGLAKFLDASVPGEFLSLHDLVENPDFAEVLTFVETIDNEMTYHTSTRRLELPKEEAEKLIYPIASEEKIDFMEFRSLMTSVVQGNLSVRIASSGMTSKLALLVCKQVLFRDDSEMLRLIIHGTTLWPEIRRILEEDVFVLYETCQEIGSTGMVNMLKNEIFDEGVLDVDDFCRFVAQVSRLPTLDIRKEPSKCQFLKDPLQSLTLWSILSGRFELTEDLLKTEQFDMIPMGLFCATILRNLCQKPEIPSPTKKVMSDVAEKCESVVVKLLRSITEFDTSENKKVIMQFMRCPLATYSSKSSIDLAADGQSETFITLPSVQSALDMEWYGTLYNVSWLVRQFLVLMSLIPYNPIVAFILLKYDKDRQQETRPVQGADKKKDESGELADLSLKSELNKQKGAKGEPGKSARFAGESVEQRRQQMKKHLSFSEKGAGGEASGAMEMQSVADSSSSLLSRESRRRSRSARTDDAASQKEANVVLRAFRAMSKLYNTPCVKFRYHVMAHFIFVILFSIVIVAQFRYSMTAIEIFVYLFILGFLLEELREANMALNTGTMSSYIADGWNIIDCFAIGLGILGFCLRMTKVQKHMGPAELYGFTDSFWWFAQLTLATSCLLFWIRLLYIAAVLESLGPKLKMIYIMIIHDFLPFLIILFIMMFGFGVAIHGLLFPNGYAQYNAMPLKWPGIIQRMFRITFYAMVGDYSLDLISGKDCSNASTTTSPCPHPLGKVLVVNLLMVIYIVVTTVLLLNLIISLFSKTVEEVDKKSFALWQFERYNLVHEFHIRFPLPPPLNILGSIFKRASKLFQRFQARGRQTRQKVTRGFTKTSVFHFLLYQAMSLRKQRKHLEGDIEIEDVEKLIGEINTSVHEMNSELQNLAKQVSERED